MLSPKNIEHFQALVNEAFDKKNKAQWEVGDLFNYGETHFAEDYLTVFDTPKGYTLATLRNYGRTCKRFSKPEHRKHQDTVSFSCFQDTASAFYTTDDKGNEVVTQQALDLIEECATDNMNRDEFRSRLTEVKGEASNKATKTTCKVMDLIKHLTKDFGLDEDTMIDISFKPVKSDKIIELPQTLGLAS